MPDNNPQNPSDQGSSNSDYGPKLPDQLKRQILEAEALIAGSNAPPQDGGQPPAQGASPSTEPAAAPPAAGDGAQPPAAPASSIQSPEDEQTWEQRFRSQSGRFEQMLRANQAMAERVNELTRSMSAMQAAGLQPPAPPAPAAERPRPKFVTTEEEDEYGPEFLEVVAKRAREEYIPEFEELSDRLKRLEGQVQGVGQVVETGVKQSMHAALLEQVPNWREINNSPAFKAWVQIPDPYSGRLRYDMIKEAYAGHETGRVVAFFKGFLSEAAGLPPNTPSPGTAAPPLANGNGSGRPSLEDFAAPGRARSAPQNLPPEKPIYTQAWIAEFYAKKLAGKYKGRELDVAATEADIFQAQHEGRIH